MMDQDELDALYAWIKEQTNADEATADALTVEIGDEPVLDRDGNWIATVNGKTFTIPPMP